MISVDLTNISLSIGQINILTITDINRKILQNVKVTNEVEQLNFSNYTNDIYFISIYQNNKIIKSFKIIKNK